MSDMRQVIIPKSDQLNADDLLAGPITIKITAVTVRGGQEQPVSISYEGDEGKPYKSCKSMNRVLVTAWGPDSSKYIGRSLTLYCDPKVKWGGMEVGGIRISHMSHIEKPLTLALTVTRANKKPYTVQPLAVEAQEPEPLISEAQKKRLEARIGELGLDRDVIKALCKEKLGKEHFAELTKDEYASLDRLLDKKAKPTAPAAQI